MPDDVLTDLRQTVAALQRELDARTAERDEQTQELARREAELRASEERYGLVSQAVAEGIYEWDIERNVLWPSPRLIDIFGFHGRELGAGDWNELVHPDDYPRYRAALRDSFKRVTPRLDCEYRVRHSDGGYRWIEDRAVPVRNAAGRAVRLTGAITDISDRKAAEQALREALEQQTATAEVLQVINSSPGDLTPVFDTLLDKAMHLCDAAFGEFIIAEGERVRAAAVRGAPAFFAELRGRSAPPSSGSIMARVLAGEPVIHTPDAKDDDLYRRGDPGEGAHPLRRDAGKLVFVRWRAFSRGRDSRLSGRLGSAATPRGHPLRHDPAAG